jgi:syntaxin-binding protein 5
MKSDFSFLYTFFFLFALVRLGQPGVDAHVRHEGESACAVVQIEFLVNEGALVTVTADDTIHFWNFQKKIPVVVHCLKFQRER